MVRKKHNPKTQIRCPDCDSTNSVYRKKDHMHWCRKCGNEWPAKKPNNPTPKQFIADHK